MKSHKSAVAINKKNSISITELLFTPTRKQCRLAPESNTWVPSRQLKLTTCFCRDTGGKRTRRAQSASFDTSDVRAIKLLPNQKRERTTEKKGYAMAQNTHSVM